MADVFISYKSRMRPRVREIAAALEELGLTVWFDAELEAGRSFAAVINSELAKARCVIVCCVGVLVTNDPLPARAASKST